MADPVLELQGAIISRLPTIRNTKMLIHNWRQVLKRAWSVRLIALAALLSGIEAMLPFIALPIPAGVFAGLTLLVTAAAFMARSLV